MLKRAQRKWFEISCVVLEEVCHKHLAKGKDVFWGILDFGKHVTTFIWIANCFDII